MPVFHSLLLAIFLSLPLCAAFPADCAADSGPARVKAPPLKEMGGQKVETKYFNLVIPQGWSMPIPVKNMPMDGISALFGSMKGDLAITINVLQAPFSAKEMATQTMENMRKGGLKTGPLEKKDNLYYVRISGKASGIAWFGAKDGLAAATLVLGKDEEKANELLAALKPIKPGLFPKSVK